MLIANGRWNRSFELRAEIQAPYTGALVQRPSNRYAVSRWARCTKQCNRSLFHLVPTVRVSSRQESQAVHAPSWAHCRDKVRGRNVKEREGAIRQWRVSGHGPKGAFQLDSRFLWPIFLQTGDSQLVKMIIAAISAAPPATKSPYSLILHEFYHSLQRRPRQKALDCHYRDYSHVYQLLIYFYLQVRIGSVGPEKLKFKWKRP